LAVRAIRLPPTVREISKKDLAEFLKSKLEKHQIPLMYEKTAAIKMTYNGKKDRKYYKMD
jgi:hypothetical protein